MGWLPPTPLIFTIASVPFHRCRYCNCGANVAVRSCCRRGRADDERIETLRTTRPSSPLPSKENK